MNQAVSDSSLGSREGRAVAPLPGSPAGVRPSGSQMSSRFSGSF